MEVLAIKTGVVPGTINFNNDEIKESVKKQIAEFKGSTFNENSIQTGKAIVSDLRKRIKEAKEVDKQVKKEYMKPYDVFHEKVNELTTLLEEPIDDINLQLDEMEAQRKAEKRKKIEKVYEETIDGFEEYIPLEKIYDPKWENKTTSVASIQRDISNVVNSAAQAITTITAMNSEAVPKALEMYKQDLSLVNAIAYVNDYEQKKIEILEREKARKAEEEERKRQKEIERIREKERAKIYEQQKVEMERQAAIEAAKEEERNRLLAEQEEKRQAEIEAMQVKQTTAKVSVVNYKIIATEAEFEQIELYLNSIGVEFIKGDF